MRGYEAPVGEMETKLAEVWAEVLKLEKVGRHDNFFELGGHSLLATRVISRIREVFHVELPLHSLFQNPTVAGLALQVDRAARTDGSASAGFAPGAISAIVLCPGALVVSVAL